MSASPRSGILSAVMASPHSLPIPDLTQVRGFVYEVETGKLREVK